MPGVYGFTLNSLQNLWDSLGVLVVKAVNKCKSKNKLTSTLRTVIFKLLRKGDKDPTLAANFHPISFLFAFYNIAICVITNRIKKKSFP